MRGGRLGVDDAHPRDDVGGARARHRGTDREALVEPDALGAEARQQNDRAEKDDERDRRDAGGDEAGKGEAYRRRLARRYRDARRATHHVSPLSAGAAHTPSAVTGSARSNES